MKSFTRKYQYQSLGLKEEFKPFFSGMKPCVFDIETTGLSPSTSKIILISLLTCDENGINVQQFLAEDFYEEKRVLKASIDYLKEKGIDYLISYNGASFDVPFVKARMDELRMGEDFSYYNFDVYSFLKKQTRLSSITASLRQKEVENYLGIGKNRKDTISGRESARLFRDYALNGDGITEKLILTHNREDVVQLHKIFSAVCAGCFDKLLKRDSIAEALSSYGLPVKVSDSLTLSVRPRLDERNSKLEIHGDQFGNAIDIEKYAANDYDYAASFNSKLKLFSLEMPVQKYGAGDCFLNIRALGMDSAFRELDSHVNGFLILRSEGEVDYSSINLLSAKLVRSAL